MHPFAPPDGYGRVKIVHSFEELVTAKFGPVVNAVCWVRTLEGDFDEVAACFRSETEIASLDEEILEGLRSGLSPMGKVAIDALIADQRLLRAHDLAPSLDCVPYTPRADASDAFPTDVCSFHADSATIAADTYLCTYSGASTEILRNDQAQARINMPSARAELLRRFEQGGGEGDFDAYLIENYHDHHYAALAGAVPFSCGIGNLWRVAIEYPGCLVPPCLHRAPTMIPGQPPRLLLIS